MSASNPVFDYRTHRLMMGVIAFSLPFLVVAISSKSLSSISASYHSEARDIFVGLLFVVGAFLFSYNGHSTKQSTASKIAGVAAVIVALFPTACDDCPSDKISTIHLIAAGTLFLILAYFCFGPFRKKLIDQSGKKALRRRIYFLCGCVMVGCMLALIIAKFTLSEEQMKAYAIMFWAEAIALGAFGVAWITAGKAIPLLVDDEEKLKLFG